MTPDPRLLTRCGRTSAGLPKNCLKAGSLACGFGACRTSLLVKTLTTDGMAFLAAALNDVICVPATGETSSLIVIPARLGSAPAQPVWPKYNYNQQYSQCHRGALCKNQPELAHEKVQKKIYTENYTEPRLPAPHVQTKFTSKW